ncbi:MAG: Crp/Fnr family transcriptional regulator [Saprospiraceae bacterium]
MNAETIWRLENIDVLNLLCPHKLSDPEQLARHKQVRVVKGDYVYMPDDQAELIFIVLSGQIKISIVHDDGKEITKAILGKGEVFGEMAIVGEALRRDYAIALTDAELCLVNRHDLCSLMRERSELNAFFMRIFGRRQLEMERRLESLIFRDSRSRIIAIVLELVSAMGERVGTEWVIRKPITHQEIANMAATSRQTVTTTLNDLRFKRLISFDRSRLLVRDLEALHREAKVSDRAS